MNALQTTHAETIGQIANDHAAASAFARYRDGKAHNTLARQARELRTFARYLAEVSIHVTGEALATDPQAWRGITWGIVAGFVQWQLREGFAIGTINLQLTTAKDYAKLAAQAGVIPADEAHLIRTVSGYSHKENRHVDDKRTEAGTRTRLSSKKVDATSLTDTQVKALKHDHPDTPQGRRDRLMMCLLLNLGLRVGEVVILRADQFDLQAGTLTFYRPKVDKLQTHNLVNGTWQAARDYITQDVLDPAAPLLRASSKNGTLTHHGVSRFAIAQRVRELGRVLSLSALSPHDCRHSWATRAAKRSDSFALRDAGGWASMAMPSRYVEAARVANEGIVLDD